MHWIYSQLPMIQIPKKNLRNYADKKARAPLIEIAFG